MSVAIACHNDAPYIAAAIRSVLEQRPPPAEIVICDDGSSDDTLRVIDQFGERVLVLRHPVNLGEASAKNTAVAAATSDVVVLLDADDEFLPGRLAAIDQAFTSDPGADLVTTDAYLVHGEATGGRWYGPTHPLPDGDQRLVILNRNPVFGHVAVRRSAFLAVGGFDATLRHATDWDCWIRMVLSGSSIVVVNEPLSRYRLHGANASGNRLAMVTAEVDLLNRAAARSDLSPSERAVVRESLEQRRCVMARERLKTALLATENSPGVRKLALEVTVDRAQPRRSRTMALAVAAWPAAARVLRRRQERTWWTGPGGSRLRRSSL